MNKAFRNFSKKYIYSKEKIYPKKVDLEVK